MIKYCNNDCGESVDPAKKYCDICLKLEDWANMLKSGKSIIVHISEMSKWERLIFIKKVNAKLLKLKNNSRLSEFKSIRDLCAKGNRC